MHLNNNLKYGIIGVGHLGNYHIQQISKLENVSLVGCFDINPSQARLAKKNYKIKIFQKIEDLFDMADVVSIATPASLHFSVASKALQEGCHVFIEKPIAHNVKEARRLISLANKKNCLIQVGHIERFNPAYRFLCESNPVPQFIETHRLAPFNIRGTDVNVVLDLMIHDIDLILNLVNSEIKTIVASGVNILSQSTDLANARIEFKNGCVANLTASRVSAKKLRKMRVFEHQRYSSLDFDKFIVDVYSATTDNKTNSSIKTLFELGDRSVVFCSNQLKPINALYEELASFINSILYSTPVAVSAIDAMSALGVALEIEQKINGNQ